MKRRKFLTLISGVVVAGPFAARSQPAQRVRQIGILMGVPAAKPYDALPSSFSRRLKELGWIEGANCHTEIRWWQGDAEGMRGVVTGLLAVPPDVVVAFTNLAVEVLHQLTASVPIVFTSAGDPVASGFAVDLAHPGGNLTGFGSFEGSMGAKWAEVLKDAASGITRILTLMYSETPIHQAFWHSIEGAAPRLGFTPVAGAVHDAVEIESAISSFASAGSGGIIVLPHAVTNGAQALIVSLALRYRLPTIQANAEFPRSGGLVSYGNNLSDAFRRAAEYADRILRGAKPGDLPIQMPTKFDLAINLKTAKALGLSISESFLLRADEVIE
jgi:putative tryptophan/tyrosine transport system substrate-binding protein